MLVRVVSPVVGAVLLVVLFWLPGALTLGGVVPEADRGDDLMTLGVDWLHPASDQAEERRGIFTFRCPDVVTRWSFANDPQDTRLYQSCPIRIEDGDDFFGNLQVGVHPGNRNQIALFSQHGYPADEGEGVTERSRYNRPFTVFTSYDQGATWDDQPIWTSEGYSEMPTGVLDSAGNVYIGFLWNEPGPSKDAWRSTITVYKAGELATVGDSYYNPDSVGGRDLQSNRIGMVRLPPHDPALESDEYAVPQDNESSDELGAAANDERPTPERILLTWAARTIDGTGPKGYTEWIDAAWTDTSAGSQWVELPSEEAIGPCLNASAPVAYRGKAYVACSVAPGYDARPRARVGEVDVWEIDPWEEETRFVGFTRLTGERPHLATTPYGYMVAAAETWNDGNPIDVQVSYGWYGSQWSRFAGEYGGVLNVMAGAGELIDAHITGLAVSEREKTAFLVYSEWVRTESDVPNPNGVGTVGEGEIRKILVAFNECQFPVQGVRMQVGAGIGGVGYNLSSNSYDLPGPRAGYPVGAYNDLQDGLLYLPGEDGEELLYIAINDYGIAQFAEVLVHAPEEFCPPTPPIPAVPVLGAPVATTISTATMTTLGASMGVAAFAMIGYLLTVKRRTAQYTTAEDR